MKRWIHSSEDNLLKLINKLPSVPGERGLCVNPIPEAPQELQSAIEAERAGADIYYFSKRFPNWQMVDLSSLTTKQNFLNRAYLKELAAVPELDDKGLVVLKYKDNHMIADGNHRLALDYLRGVPERRVNVVDVEDLH